MDVIKTKLQTQDTNAGILRDTSDEVLHDVKYKDIVSAVKTMIKEEGIYSFTKGMFPRALQASLSGALSWVTYETMKTILTK